MFYEHHLCMSIILLNDISLAQPQTFITLCGLRNCSRAHSLRWRTHPYESENMMEGTCERAKERMKE